MRRDNYSLTILTIPRFKTWFQHNEEEILKEYNLRADDVEHLYDYCVLRATENIVRRCGSNIVGTYRHEIYDMVYQDRVQHFLTEYLADKFEHHQIEFVHQYVKILVLGDKLILGVKK